MENKELIEKVVNGSITLSELIELTKNLKDIVLDFDNSFETYYNSKVILETIERYKRGEVDENYLSYWSNAYTFITMTSVWRGSANRDLFPIEVIMYKISDYLDVLFFVKEFEEGMLDSVVKQIIKADKIYHHLKNMYNFKIVFVSECQELNIVFIDEQKKEYAEFEMLVEDDKVLEAEQVDRGKFREIVTKLKKEQYVEI